MKTVHTLFIATIALFVIYSCESVEPLYQPDEPVPVNTRSFITINLPAETKVGHEYAEGKLKTAWEAGDRISVSYDNGGTYKSVIFTQTGDITNGGKTASFSSEESVPAGTTFYAYYPATSGSEDRFLVDISSQEGTLASLSQTDIMMATGSYAEGIDFEFKHQTAFLHLQDISLEGSPSSAIKSVSIMGNTVGNQIAWNNGAPAVNTGSIVTTGSIPMEAGRITDAYIAFIPNNAESGDSYKVVITLMDGKQFSLSWYAAKEYEVSKMYRLTSQNALAQKATATKNYPVLLVAFNDLSFTVANPREAFDKLFNASGMPNNMDPGSIAGYYRDQSNGKENLHFDVYDVITLDNGYAYYGSDGSNIDTNIKRLVFDALPKTSFNFTQYDNTGNGEVDDLIIIFAGLSQEYGAGDDHIWSYSRYMGMDRYSAEGYDVLWRNGISVNSFLVTSELSASSVMAGPGVICHELGHKIYDLPDLYYRTDKHEGKYDDNKHLYELALMADGDNNHNGHIPSNMSSVEREYAGFLTPTVISAGGSYTIRSIEGNKAYRINTSVSGEYFLIEYRNRKGWDAGWSYQGRGLVVYHVDKSSNIAGGSDTAESLWSNHIPNCYQDHYCAYPVSAANPGDPFSYSYWNSLFYPGVNNNTSLELKAWDGTTTATLTNISDGNGAATFTVTLH